MILPSTHMHCVGMTEDHQLWPLTFDNTPHIFSRRLKCATACFKAKSGKLIFQKTSELGFIPSYAVYGQGVSQQCKVSIPVLSLFQFF